MYKLVLFLAFFIFISGRFESLILMPSKEIVQIKYQNELTLDLPVSEIKNKVIYDEVEKREVILYQYLSEEGFPVYYSRNIRTGVCYDNQCKLLNITLFWNPTGRYLGFELAGNEFLSKQDHLPFSEEEYIRLNELLGDPTLPLGQFTYNQIAAKSKASLSEVDGISGATSKDVLEYVIKGSAYTTFAIYELVYGNTKSEVEVWTDEMMNDDYLKNILTKAPYEDKLWVAELVHGRLADYPQSKVIVLGLLDSDDYSLAEKCLNSLVPEDLIEEVVQNKLIDKFPSFDFGMKNWTVELFKEVSEISPDVVIKLNNNMLTMEVPIVSGILDMYRDKGIHDPNTMVTIKEIADSENRYLARKAEDYINQIRE